MIVEAIVRLRPNAEWGLQGDSYEGLEWWDKVQPKPTVQEINDMIATIQAELDATEYQRLREPEYPAYVEFIDAYYWKTQGDSTKMDEYINKVKEVKEKYPKVNNG